MRQIVYWATMLFSLALLWSAPGSTWAQAPASAAGAGQKPISPAQRKILLAQARSLYKTGRGLFQQRRFGDAIPKFLLGVAAVKRLESAAAPAQKKRYLQYRLGFYATLGVAYQWRKQLVQARAYYARCSIASAPKRIRTICKKYLPEVEKQLAYINIESKPAEADLLLRTGQRTSWTKHRSPHSGWRMPGVLHVQLAKTGYTTLRRLLTLRPGVKLKVLYTLEKPSCPAPASTTPKVPVGDKLQLGTTVTTAAAMPSMGALPQPFQGGTMPPWQIALVAGGVVIGAAVLVGGVTAVAYGVSNRHYVIKKNP